MRLRSGGARSGNSAARRKVYHLPMRLAALLLFGSAALAQPKYDLLLEGGQVIDPKNRIAAVRDVAIASGRIAAVAENIDPGLAKQVIDAAGLYVTPGLIDIHVHV